MESSTGKGLYGCLCDLSIERILKINQILIFYLKIRDIFWDLIGPWVHEGSDFYWMPCCSCKKLICRLIQSINISKC